MPTLILETPEGIELRTEIAGVGSRSAAAALDLVLLFSAYIVTLLGVAGIAYGLGTSGDAMLDGIDGFIFGLLLGAPYLFIPLYFIVAHILMDGSSPGKRMLKLRVVSSSGYSATNGQHILRGLLSLIDIVPLPAPLGMMFIAATPRSKRLGDLAAGTLVINEPRRSSRDELWPDESWSTREVKQLALSPGMATRLTEEDMNLMRDAIQRREMPTRLRQKLYRDIVSHYSERLGFEPSDNTRTSLKELYLFGREYRGA